MGALLTILGLAIVTWRLVDPNRGSGSFIVPADLQLSGLVAPSVIVGWAVVGCGLIVIAVWAGIDGGASVPTSGPMTAVGLMTERSRRRPRTP